MPGWGQIQNGQSPESKRNPRFTFDPKAAIVRPTVDDGVAHPLDPRGIDRLDRAAMEYPRDPAHAALT